MAKHYVSCDMNGVILRGFSDDFEQPTANDICISIDGGRHFELDGIVNPLIRDNNGVPLYKLIGGVISERTEEERQEETFPALETPTLEERTAALESALLEMVIGDIL